ncbi:MAG: M13 family metallopeptidase [Eubacterium sp.]|nr:M13 family metallopeptidase [Eubacterium sp.]
MKRLIVLMLIAALMMLSSCGGAQKEEKSSEEGFDPNKWLDIDVEGAVTDSMSADPVDDFAFGINGDTVRDLKIPEGKKITGGMYDAEDENEKRIISLMTDDSIKCKDAEQVQALYGMLMDWDTRNKHGAEPIKKYLEKIQSVSTMDEMTELMCDRSMRNAVGMMFDFYVFPDKDDPEAYTVYLDAPALTMEDSAEYVDEITDSGKLLKETAEKCWPVVLTSAGMDEKEAEDIVARSFDFETKLAEHIMTSDYKYEKNEEIITHNPATPDEVTEMAGSFPIKTIMDAHGIGESKTYDVKEPDYFKALSSIYTDKNLEDMKAWLITRLAETSMDLLDKDTRDETTKITNDLAGVKGTEKDDAMAADIVNDELPLPLDNMYIEKYCTEEMRNDILDIISMCVDTYRVMLAEEDWLSKETQEKAVEKLDNIVVRAVYPDDIETWPDLKVSTFDDGSNLFDSVIAIRNYKEERMAKRVNKKAEREYWDRNECPTSMTNAFYDPQDNSINILGGMLLGCMYGKDKMDEENLGAIGIVIGHEISHAFDNSGALYDKVGKMANWWTDADKKAFDERAKKVIKYYDRIEPLEGCRCKGSMVQGEATADMGGMKCVLRAAADMEGFDYKKFFESYAHVWAVSNVESYERQRILTNVHPVAYLRVNVPVQQMQEFYDTYDVKEGDGMYLAPEDRISIW